MKMNLFIRCSLFLVFILITKCCADGPKDGAPEDDVISPPDIMKHPNWRLIKDQDICGFANTDRIIGGKNASLGAYPWLARVGYKNSSSKSDDVTFRCGASLINKLYVLTAAHCLVNLPKGLEIFVLRFGEHDTTTDPDCENDYCNDPIQDIRPIRIISHESYNKIPFKNDIGIIRLRKPITFSDSIRPICLIRDELLTKNFIGGVGEVAGWGIYDINLPKPSEILQTIKLPITKMERCVESFKKIPLAEDTQMCVGGVKGEDSCGGDSGGPLMKIESLDNTSPKYFLIGVVSFGAKRCGETDSPAIYTRISAFLPWILDNMAP